MFNTRIAPSPTGDMHIGTARTAYFNYLAARASGGKFIIRIDDTDINRNKPEYVETIIKTMDWLGLDYDNIIYQSHRFDVYLEIAKKIIDTGLAKHNNGAIILNLKSNITFPTCWHDNISGKINISSDDFERMDGIGLIKVDGSPAYNFCSIIDDIMFNVNYIIRGTDHITNTSKQVILHHIISNCLEISCPLPVFAHVGLIGIEGKPMSKRDGAASMLYYREKGYDADAMLNFLVRMGWGPKIDDKTTKMLPKDKMIELFLNKGKMRSSMSNFDLDKLESFDRKYKASKKIWRNKEKLL